MIEAYSFAQMYIYSWIASTGNKGKWKLLRRIDEFDPNLVGGVQYPVLISPDFQKILEFDGIITFNIRNLLNGSLMYEVPKHMIYLDSKPQEVINRFKWIDGEHFCFIDSTGFERMIKIGQDFQEVGYSMIPGFKMEEIAYDHYYYKPQDHKVDKVLERLKLNCRVYKRQYYLGGRTTPDEILPWLYDIDFWQAIRDKRHRVDLPFTFLQWKITEQIREGAMTIHDIDAFQFKLMQYNILPNGDTILHLLATRSDYLKVFLEYCHPDKNDRSKDMYELLFIQNL